MYEQYFFYFKTYYSFLQHNQLMTSHKIEIVCSEVESLLMLIPGYCGDYNYYNYGLENRHFRAVC